MAERILTAYKLTEDQVDDFIRAWQTSSSYEEVMKKTGMPKMQCRRLSTYLRCTGKVPLKKFCVTNRDGTLSPERMKRVALQALKSNDSSQRSNRGVTDLEQGLYRQA